MNALLMILVVIVYFFPSIVAEMRRHHNAAAITMTNLLFGWTFIGWAVSMIWALTDTRRQA